MSFKMFVKKHVFMFLICKLMFLTSMLTVTHQGAACDAASVHFGPTIRKTDIYLFDCRVIRPSSSWMRPIATDGVS